MRAAKNGMSSSSSISSSSTSSMDAMRALKYPVLGLLDFLKLWVHFGGLEHCLNGGLLGEELKVPFL